MRPDSDRQVTIVAVFLQGCPKCRATIIEVYAGVQTSARGESTYEHDLYHHRSKHWPYTLTGRVRA